MTLPVFNRKDFGDTRVAALSKLAAASLHEVMGRRNELPSAIKPIDQGMRVCGPACTVSTPARSNLVIHEAIYAAKPGDVLVVQADGYFDAGYWGEIMNSAAIFNGLAGLVIDAGVRDVDTLLDQNFPVFSRVVSLRGTEKYPGGTINERIEFPGTIVSPGDYIVGDADGVVVVPAARLDSVVKAASEREAREAQIVEELGKGKSTLEIFGFQ